MILNFVTTNTGKFEEVQRWLYDLAPDITLEHYALDLPEYQSLDVVEVAKGKSDVAWQIVGKPVLIDDGGIYLMAYNQFPGTFSKYMIQALGFEGIWKLAHDDPRAYFLSCLIFKNNATDYHIFQGHCYGHLIPYNATISAPASLPYTKIFIPEGYESTLASLRGSEQEKTFHHRYKALQQFVQWYRASNTY